MLPEKLTKQELEQLRELDPELAEAAATGGASYVNNMPQDESSWPRLLLLQGLSDLVKSGEGRSGGLAHSASGHIYTESAAKDPITIIPIFYYFSRIMLAPIEDGGGILCQSPDGKFGQGNPGGHCGTCDMSQWIDRDPPACAAVHNWVSLIPDAPEEHQVVVWQGSKTNYPPLKEFNRLVKTLQSAPFMYQFRLSAEQADNKFKNWIYKLLKHDDGRLEKKVMDRDDWKEILPRAKNLYDQCRASFEASSREARAQASPADHSVSSARSLPAGGAPSSPTGDAQYQTGGNPHHDDTVPF